MSPSFQFALTRSGAGTPDPALANGWRKSSYSFSNGNCVEIASWRKPSRSGGTGACVEVGHGDAVVGVRDTKLEHSPVLEFPSGAWQRFVGEVKSSR